jgi:hypothetical protein
MRSRLVEPVGYVITYLIHCIPSETLLVPVPSGHAPSRLPAPDRLPEESMLRRSASARLAGALLIIGGLWAMTFWAMR